VVLYYKAMLRDKTMLEYTFRVESLFLMFPIIRCARDERELKLIRKANRLVYLFWIIIVVTLLAIAVELLLP
jgi:hypothetical protein